MTTSEIITNFVTHTVFKTKHLAVGVARLLTYYISTATDDCYCNIYNEMQSDEKLFQKLLPLKVTLGRKKPCEVLKNFVATNNSRKALTGICYDFAQGAAVATTGKMLAYCDLPDAIADSRQENENSRIVTTDGANVIQGSFPTWNLVVPPEKDYRLAVELRNVAAAAGYCKAMLNFSSICTSSDSSMIPVVKIGDELYYVDQLGDVLTSFAAIGDDVLTFHLTAKCSPSVITGTHGLTAVIMPLRVKDSVGYLDLPETVAKFDSKTFFKDYIDCHAQVDKFTGIYGNLLNDYHITTPTDGELAHLQRMYARGYLPILAHVLAIAVGGELDRKKIRAELSECDCYAYSDRTVKLNADFVEIIRSIKTETDCRKHAPALLQWLREYNDLLDNYLVPATNTDPNAVRGYRMNIEMIESAMIARAKERGLESIAAQIFGTRFDAVKNQADKKQSDSERQRAEMTAAIPADSGIVVVECSGKWWYQHKSLGRGIYRTIEETLHEIEMEKRRVAEMQAQLENERLERERQEKEKAAKENLFGFESVLTGVRRAKVIDYLNRPSPIGNIVFGSTKVSCRGKKLRFYVECLTAKGYTPIEREVHNSNGRLVTRYRMALGDDLFALESKTEYEYAVYLRDHYKGDKSKLIDAPVATDAPAPCDAPVATDAPADNAPQVNSECTETPTDVPVVNERPDVPAAVPADVPNDCAPDAPTGVPALDVPADAPASGVASDVASDVPASNDHTSDRHRAESISSAPELPQNHVRGDSQGDDGKSPAITQVGDKSRSMARKKRFSPKGNSPGVIYRSCMMRRTDATGGSTGNRTDVPTGNPANGSAVKTADNSSISSGRAIDDSS